MSLNNLAMVHQQEDKSSDAADLLREAVTLQTKLVTASNHGRDQIGLDAIEHNIAVALTVLNEDR
jgi:hypothetical protein